jgi:predicted ester cyclase
VNERDLSVTNELFTSDTVTHQLRSAPGEIPTAPRRPDDVRHELQSWFAAFPDVRFEIEQQVAEGDLVVTRSVMRGTHDGTRLGVPATNRSVTLRMTHTVRIIAGQIVEDWLLVEWYGMLEQLGLVPPLRELLSRSSDDGGGSRMTPSKVG